MERGLDCVAAPAGALATAPRCNCSKMRPVHAAVEGVQDQSLCPKWTSDGIRQQGDGYSEEMNAQAKS